MLQALAHSLLSGVSLRKLAMASCTSRLGRKEGIAPHTSDVCTLQTHLCRFDQTVMRMGVVASDAGGLRKKECWSGKRVRC